MIYKKITWLWYCPKKNLLFTLCKDTSFSWTSYYPKGISYNKIKYPIKTGCVRIGKF